MVKAAKEIQKFMIAYGLERKRKDHKYFEARIGIHSGNVISGVVGKSKFAFDIWGDTVNTASRMETTSEANRINISGATHTFVKEHFNCVHRGKIEAKHKGQIDMYFVEG
jgi:class 3 adenylate cyclase